MTKLLKRFLRSDSGTATTEYALIATLIGTAIVATTIALSVKLDAGF